MTLPTTTRIIIVALLVLAIGSVFYFNRPESSASRQSTDDAYVQADFTTLSSQVNGAIEEVLVEDNQQVRAGELLAVIDDRDYVIAVDAAKAQVAKAQASITSLGARLQQQNNTIVHAQAAVAADEAALTLATANLARYRNLAADGSGTVQALQQAEAQLAMQSASVDKSQAGLQSARQQVDILAADLEQARATLAQSHAAQATAELQLSYTRITAPISGVIGQNSLRVGAFVTVGKALLAIVPLDAVYVTAHYRETQMARIQVGQAVDIQADAFPGILLTGTVESLGPASGVSYSAIAPHNATGNFTKIVQRLPVRIRIDEAQERAPRLRVGMSVTPTIHVE